jgi:hypothetical protein
MPEVGIGAGLERFELVANDHTYAVIDIVNGENATITLNVLAEFPLHIAADEARTYVEAWNQRANIQDLPYAVKPEQREI